MNKYQIVNEVLRELRDLAWSGSSTPVFHDDSVRVIGGSELEAFGEGLIPPAALLRPGPARPDPLYGEEPDLLEFSLEVAVITIAPGDRMGEYPIMGAHRQGLTDSRGRGLLEVEEEVLNALSSLGDKSGVRLQAVAESEIQAAPSDADNVIAGRIYTFQCQCTADRFYHAPIAVTATDEANGNARIRWTDPSARGDRVDIQIRRSAGATAPANSTQGTLVANVALGIENYQDDPGAGQFSYTVFGSYNDHGGSSRDRFSDAEQGTQATVTVT